MYGRSPSIGSVGVSLRSDHLLELPRGTRKTPSPSNEPVERIRVEAFHKKNINSSNLQFAILDILCRKKLVDTDLEKIASIKYWPIPKNLKQLRFFFLDSWGIIDA